MILSSFFGLRLCQPRQPVGERFPLRARDDALAHVGT